MTRFRVGPDGELETLPRHPYPSEVRQRRVTADSYMEAVNIDLAIDARGMRYREILYAAIGASPDAPQWPAHAIDKLINHIIEIEDEFDEVQKNTKTLKRKTRNQ